MTDAERLLWSKLRRRQLRKCKFRRQHCLDKYIVDFVCLEHKLVIELDGGQHAQQQAYDNQRTQDLARRGFRVLRFWNTEVLLELHVVLDTIWHQLEG